MASGSHPVTMVISFPLETILFILVLVEDAAARLVVNEAVVGSVCIRGCKMFLFLRSGKKTVRRGIPLICFKK